ncbi:MULTISPECIES: HU family DNA-binding protein [unclassified Moraxella]|uniref:HU family DNA-binding protein n=1 Tax=unclassified Moraxella TaxID=2685852 RepID=UPI003AF51A47
MQYAPTPTKGNIMNKSELIAKIAEQAGISKTQATASLQAFELAVIDTLANGGTVELKGFGTFKVTDRKAKTGRNPATGEPMQIPAKKAPVFKAGKALKDAVN